MIQRRLPRTNRLGHCLAALRVLAKSNSRNRYILVKGKIDEYLRTHPFDLARALERLREAIHHGEFEGDDEYWSIVKEHVRLLLHSLT